MHPRERVLTVLNHRLPDRVPFIPKIWIDLAANVLALPYVDVLNDPALGMLAIIRAALELQLDGARLFTFPHRRIVESNGEYRQIGFDGAVLGTLDIQGGWATQLVDDSNFNLSDPAMIAAYQFWHTSKPAVANRQDVERITVPSASFYEQAGYGAIVQSALALTGNQLCCIGDCSSGTLAFQVALRGLARAMLDLVEEPGLTHSIMEKGIQVSFERAKFFIDRGVKVLRYNDSVANMSVISPRHWRQFILPPLKTFCAEVHHYAPDAKIYCHICGNVMPILNDLVASGLDCIAPLDPLGGFTVAQARQKVGDDFVLMGGINTLSFVESPPSEIAAEAKRCIETGGPRGAFILGSGCVVPRNAKRDNLLVLHQSAERYGTYDQARSQLALGS